MQSTISTTSRDEIFTGLTLLPYRLGPLDKINEGIARVVDIRAMPFLLYGCPFFVRREKNVSLMRLIVDYGQAEPVSTHNCLPIKFCSADNEDLLVAGAGIFELLGGDELVPGGKDGASRQAAECGADDNVASSGKRFYRQRFISLATHHNRVSHREMLEARHVGRDMIEQLVLVAEGSVVCDTGYERNCHDSG